MHRLRLENLISLPCVRPNGRGGDLGQLFVSLDVTSDRVHDSGPDIHYPYVVLDLADAYLRPESQIADVVHDRVGESQTSILLLPLTTVPVYGFQEQQRFV